MPDVVRIGQTLYSWTSTAFKLDNQPYTGIVAADIEQKRERKTVWAARQDGLPLGMTAGKYEVGAFSAKFLIDTYDAFTDYLTIKGLGSYGDPPFNWLCQASEPVSLPSAAGMKPITVAAPYVWIVGEKESREEGIDETVIEVDFAALWVTKNNKQLWSAVRALGAV